MAESSDEIPKESPAGNDVMDLVRFEPSKENSLFALAMAADLLVSAKERFEDQDFNGTLSDSKNSIRLAVSAVLYNDGYMAGSLETSIYYIEKNYAGMFPTSDWKVIEKISAEEKGGLFEAFSKALGIGKEKGSAYGSLEVNAKRSLEVAENFILAVRHLFESQMEGEMGEGVAE